MGKYYVEHSIYIDIRGAIYSESVPFICEILIGIHAYGIVSQTHLKI